MRTKRKKDGNASKFKPSYYVRIYRLAGQGFKNRAIADSLGVNRVTFRSWVKKDPALREALKEARTVPEGEDSPNTLNAFVYQRLPSKLKPIWDAMCEAEEEDNGEKRLELLTANCGRKTMQHLWLHALVSKHFNRNEACRVTGIARSTLNEWIKNDPDFHALADEIFDMKKDFVEGCLMNLVAGGDSAATIFAAKSLLKKEGYDPKTIVQIQGNVRHAHFDVAKLLGQVSLAAQKEMLAAMRGEQAKNGPEVKQLEEYTIDDGEEDSEDA